MHRCHDGAPRLHPPQQRPLRGHLFTSLQRPRTATSGGSQSVIKRGSNRAHDPGCSACTHDAATQPVYGNDGGSGIEGRRGDAPCDVLDASAAGGGAGASADATSAALLRANTSAALSSMASAHHVQRVATREDSWAQPWCFRQQVLMKCVLHPVIRSLRCKQPAESDLCAVKSQPLPERAPALVATHQRAPDRWQPEHCSEQEAHQQSTLAA